MRLRSRAAACAQVLVIVAAPGSALAASGGEGGFGQTILLPAINLLILIAVLVYFGRKPIQAFFRERRDHIKVELDGAAALRDEADRKLDEWQRKLSELESELARIRETARERAESERAQILADAERSAERIRGDAQAAVEQEIRRARQALREAAADLAVELAAQKLSSEVTDADRDRLLTEFIERVESSPVADGTSTGARS